MRLRTTAAMVSLLCIAVALPQSVSALGNGDALPLPPPPGPYLSSRPQLELAETPVRHNDRTSFVRTMPSMPMYYMPNPNQLPPPPLWWRGPVGR